MLKKLITKHLPAKSLYLVVFISFIISVILLALISNSYFNQIEVLKYQHLKKLIDCNNSAIQLSLADNSFLKTSEYTEVPDKIYEEVNTQAKIEQWGGFSIVKSKSQWKDLKYQKAALSGNYLFEDEIQGLYLADRGKYLSIAGETRLSGNTYLPSLGIRSVYIDGKPYSGTSLVYGKEKTSKKEIPKISDELQTWIKNAYLGNYGTKDSLGSISSLFTDEIIKQSFLDKLLVFESSDEINLSNIELTGHIIIRSDSAVYINRNLEADGIIAIAPIVIVESDFKGSLQVLARDSLLIDKNAHLQYPSFAAVYNPEGTKAFAYMEEGSQIEGGLLCASGMGSGEDAELILKSDATVHGLVYSTGSISHSGNVFGSMFLQKFVLKTKRGYYENHLLNAIVDPINQTKELIVPNVFVDKEKGIIDWLHE